VSSVLEGGEETLEKPQKQEDSGGFCGSRRRPSLPVQEGTGPGFSSTTFKTEDVERASSCEMPSTLLAQPGVLQWTASRRSGSASCLGRDLPECRSKRMLEGGDGSHGPDAAAPEALHGGVKTGKLSAGRGACSPKLKGIMVKYQVG